MRRAWEVARLAVEFGLVVLTALAFAWCVAALPVIVLEGGL